MRRGNLKSSEQGNIAFAAAALVIGMAGLTVVTQKQSSQQRKAKNIKYESSVSKADDLIYNAAGYLSSLFEYSSAGHPGLYASNYHANSWELSEGPHINENYANLSSPSTIQIKLPDANAADFTNVHKTGGGEPPRKITNIQLLGVQTDSARPFFKNKAFFRLTTEFTDERVNQVKQRRVKAIVDLPPPPPPRIRLSTPDITSSDLSDLNSGAAQGYIYGYISENSGNMTISSGIGHMTLFTTDSGESTVRVNIAVEGVASKVRYGMSGNSSSETYLDNHRMNYLSTTNAAIIAFQVNANTLASGACEWGTSTDDPYAGVNQATFETLTGVEQTDIYYERLAQGYGQAIEQATQNLQALQQQLTGQISSGRGHISGVHQNLRGAANNFFNQAQRFASANTLNAVNGAMNSMNSHYQQLKAGYTETITETVRVERCGPFGYTCWWEDEQRTRTVTHRMTGALSNATFAVKGKAVEINTALNTLAGNMSDLEDISQYVDGEFETSTRTLQVGGGDNFSLNIELYDVQGNLAATRILVFTVDPPVYSTCSCDDVGMYNYENKSRADIIGDGGKVCSTAQKAFGGDLHVITGRAPRCKALFVQENRQQCGCFSEDTLIRMADGTDKKISSISPGDLLFNPITGKSVRALYTIKGPEEKPLIKITTDQNKSVTVTSEHPFLTPYGYKQAKDLMEGMQFVSQNSLLKIDSVELLPMKEKPPIVWNIMLDGGKDEANHMLLGNGVPSGDLFIQNKLKKELTKKNRRLNSKAEIKEGSL